VKHNKEVSTILNVSHNFYERSLIFYPKDLRSDFGNEMIEDFDEQGREAYSRSGLSGLVRVWFSAMGEIVTVAFPARMLVHATTIVGVTATLAFMLWFVGYIGYVMETACPGCGR
jgi:hypothetical protein